jgi:copper chaperone
MTKPIELNIEGMSCNNCVRHVKEALEGVAGVQKAEVSLSENRALVLGDVLPELLIEAVGEEGYKAQVV